MVFALSSIKFPPFLVALLVLACYKLAKHVSRRAEAGRRLRYISKKPIQFGKWNKADYPGYLNQYGPNFARFFFSL